MNLTKLNVLAIAALMAMSACAGEPRIDSVTPDQLVSGVPTLVEIKGRGFQAGTQVWIGTVECPEVVFAGGRMLVVLPPGELPAGVAPVRLQTPSGKSATKDSALTVKSGLRLDSLRPAFMPQGAQGVAVSIAGQGFRPGVKVLFGEMESPAVEVKDQTFLTALAPDLPSGPLDVKVVDEQGVTASLFQAFQVMAPEVTNRYHSFREQALELGINENGQHKNGVSSADVNGDGLDDLFFAASSGNRLFLATEDGRFRDATAEYGLDQYGSKYSGIFGDFDNDGRPDLVLTGKLVALFHNQDGRRFVEVTERVGVKKDAQAFSAAWGDVDADGFPELFLGYSKIDDRLYRNLGGRFEPAFEDTFAKMLKAQEFNNTQPTTFAGNFADYDLDGWVDLFVGVRGQPSAFYHNEKGKQMKNVITELGLKVQIPATNPPLYFIDWGLSFGDYNNDGYLDLFSTSGPGGFYFYRNREGKAFENAAHLMRADIVNSPLGSAFGDFDNDGLLDLAVSDNLAGLSLLRNNGDGSFTNLTAELGLTELPRSPIGILWMDVNHDGALDLVVSQYLDRDLIYVNTPYAGRHYLAIKLAGSKQNSMGLGAIVTVQTGATVLTRHVSGGDGYLSQQPPTLHFGLGDAERVGKITVRWPGGEIQTLDGATADQTLIITQPGERKSAALPPPPPEPPAPAPGATAKP